MRYSGESHLAGAESRQEAWRLGAIRTVFAGAGDRQIDMEGGSRARAARYSDLAAVGRNDPVHDRQAKPGAFAHVLGGEERLEDALQHVGRDAASGVAHG